MTDWVKISRITGEVLKRKTAPSMERVFHKPYVWLESIQDEKLVYDPDTQKLERTVTQPDLSDLGIDVDPTSKYIQGWAVVALTAQELLVIRNNKIAQTDSKLAQIVEDILVNISEGTPLTRSAFPDKVWAKINARRALRGDSPV